MSDFTVAFHVDKIDGSLAVALNNAVNYANALSGQAYHMVLVVNSAAVKELVAEKAALLEKLQPALKLGLEVRACQNALAATDTAPEQLFAGCQVVPAGIVELVRLQKQGYAYIKP